MSPYDGGRFPAPDVEAVLKETGALREGHFLLASGRHSNRFFLLPQLFQFPQAAEPLVRGLAGLLETCPAETVVGPAVGGIILSYEVARLNGWRALYAEKTEARAGGGRHAEMELRRDFRLVQDEPVVVVEDVLTTGGSVRSAMAAVERAGGRVVAVGALVDRSESRARFGVPLRSLWQTQAVDWEPDQCPLCREGVPLERPKQRRAAGI
ncbi:MAG: orotate phosphoribosyltransferase [Thermaerobacterales bacterium]